MVIHFKCSSTGFDSEFTEEIINVIIPFASALRMTSQIVALMTEGEVRWLFKSKKKKLNI